MGSNASEYWAEAAQSWFEASVRCDVNCGLNTYATQGSNPELADPRQVVFCYSHV